MPGKLRPALKEGLLPYTPNLKGSGSEALDRAIRITYVGMAHFAQGPQCCASCASWGYDKVIRDSAGNAVDTIRRTRCCAKYHELTGLHGAPVPSHALACRHYHQKKKKGGA
jgi:hypothetical protein